MSDYYIPFQVQSEIMKRLPVKSLVQFRSVSKQWKSFIDCPKLIKTYHINHPNPQHHLLLQYKFRIYISNMDDITFPQQKFPLTDEPEPLKSLRYAFFLGSVDGLLCFYGFYQDVETPMAVIWNPSVRKCVGIVLPKVFPLRYTRIAFGVSPHTSDPTLVKINAVQTPTISWEVQVFTLSSRVWKTVYTGAPFTPWDLTWDHVFIHGIIYWLTDSFILSFDLKSEMFGELCIPDRLVTTDDEDGMSLCGVFVMVKLNESSLGLLEYYQEDGMSLCGVWMRQKDGVNKPFTKIYTIKVEGKSVFDRVLGFRNNGEVLLQFDDDDDLHRSQVEVYEPSSGRISSVGISGERPTLTAWSYMETLLLLNQSSSIIH